MANRKGVFIGAYVPNELKESLRRRAAAEHRTLSQEITRILTEAIHGRNLPPGSIDRRAPNSPTRRRASDPFPRRRKDDLPYAPETGKGGDDRCFSLAIIYLEIPRSNRSRPGSASAVVSPPAT